MSIIAAPHMPAISTHESDSIHLHIISVAPYARASQSLRQLLAFRFKILLYLVPNTNTTYIY